VSGRERDVLDALLRRDLTSFTRKAFEEVNPGDEFLDNWHIDCLTWHLEKCYRGDIKRLIITLPPRHLKSICASVAFPAWVLGQDPTRKLICVSYSHDLARKHALDTRTVMESAWYRRVFRGTRFHPRKCTETELMTSRMGLRYATSVGGTLTGLGGNFLIVDDPIKSDEVTSEAERNRVNHFYDSVLYSRLNNKNDDVIILIMQRLHVDDLVGHVQDKDKWTVLEMPAIAEQEQTYEIRDGEHYTRRSGEVLHEAREDARTLEVIKRQLGTPAFEAQYQQRPFPPGGTLIKRAWLQTYSEPLPRVEYDQVVQSWDTASTVSESSDHSVCITFGIMGQIVHVLDVARVQLEYPHLRRRVMAEANKWKADAVLIERSSSGIALMQDLKCEGLLRPISYKPRVDKVARLEGHSAKFEAGYVLLPEEAPWLDDLKAELLAFPRGRHDDQVDALSQFLEWLARRRWRERCRAEIEERDRTWRARREDTRSPPTRSTWYDRNMRGLGSNEALLARYGRGNFG
jgi:predicted phage terminase large subunit-like protein